MHIGACTELEIEWAKLIENLVPSAKKGLVRATSCGSEAVQMAIRLARIYTGRDKIVILAGSYHGKQDITIYARRTPPIGIYNVRGIPRGVIDDVFIIPSNNLEAVEGTLMSREVACLILHANSLYTSEYIKGLREITDRYGTVFLMDEVVSGFRYSKGGAQEYYGVTPDLTALGKVIGGGVPIGAICGRKEIMEIYSFKDNYWNRFVRIAVGGTWNAQPITIAGGIAMLKAIKTGSEKIYPRLYEIGRRLTKSFNEIADDLGVSALAYGLPIDNPTNISLNLFNRSIPSDKEYLWHKGPASFDDYIIKSKFYANERANYATYLSMINNGIFSYSGRSGSLCTKYTDDDLLETEQAYDITLRMLKENKLIGTLN
jgi:glutamate-1-semialdehyde 2,1-aminomutase